MPVENSEETEGVIPMLERMMEADPEWSPTFMSRQDIEIDLENKLVGDQDHVLGSITARSSNVAGTA